MAVEIPDDEVPPPGWDQWASLPTPAPEPQVGALVRRWDGHMVAGSSGHGAEASSSRAGRHAPSDPAASLGQGQERVDAAPPHFADAQEEQQLWEELRSHGASLNWALNEALRIHGGPAWRVFQVCRRSLACRLLLRSVVFAFVFAAWHSWVFVCWWQELELRARDRYGALDQMSAELRQLQEQRDALDALAEALRTRDGWLAYRAEALRDQLLELEGQSTARASAVERVRMALINRDEALQQARGDLERARTVAADWEAEVVSVRAQHRQVHAELEEARSRRSQAEERAREAEQKAKEAEELKAALSAKVAAVAAAEVQLRQERAARQEAEGQLQQERAALVDARTTLEREHAALKRAQASLKERENEVSKLNGELIALSISNVDQRRTLKKQSATVVSLQQAVEGGRQALEGERKQVEGELPLRSFVLLIFPSGVCSLLDFLCSWYPGLRTALGRVTDRAETLQAACDSSERELLELRAAALETCQAVEEGEARAGSSLASRLRTLSGHVSRRMRRALHLGVQKALGVVRSHYEVNFEVVASGYVVPEGVKDEVAMEHADALPADAAETLTEDFMEFLFPDAADADAPQA
jgi:predicted  nucleic acid-binding Zn-ribbon protein